jgi:DNA-binding transcriptional MerR regulator
MKIGELARLTATNVETVRYYERIGILTAPPRSGANYRRYEPEHVARLSFVRRARALGFTLNDVRELLALSSDAGQSCEAIDAMAVRHRDTIEGKIADLAALREQLDDVIDACGRGQVAQCRIIEALGPPSPPASPALRSVLVAVEAERLAPCK